MEIAGEKYVSEKILVQLKETLKYKFDIFITHFNQK